MADRRRAGSFVLLALVGGASLLMLPPLEVGAVRLAGVSLLWWYVGAIAPAVAVLAITLALRTPRRADAVGSSDGPLPRSPRDAAAIVASEPSPAGPSAGSKGRPVRA